MKVAWMGIVLMRGYFAIVESSFFDLFFYGIEQLVSSFLPKAFIPVFHIPFTLNFEPCVCSVKVQKINIPKVGR